MIPRRQIEKLLDEMEPIVARAFELAVAEIRSRARIEALAAAIAEGRATDAIRLAGIREGSWGPLNQAIREAYVGGAGLAAATAPAAVGFVFNVSNLRAEQWLRDNSSQLITRLNEEQREVVRYMLSEGVQRGDNPRRVALDIAGRVDRATGRRRGGAVGLTRQQATFALNARRELRSGDRTRMAAYLRRELRDRRFDGLVSQAMRAGRPVAEGDITRMMGRYTDRLLKHRADVIARTETLQAVNAGQDEAIKQAVNDGLIRNADNLVRVWRTASDSRVRDIHQPMNGQRRGSTQGVNVPFTSGNGEQLQFPGDQSLGASAANIIQCRCVVQYEVDWIAEAG